jgi:hypothetical protein
MQDRGSGGSVQPAAPRYVIRYTQSFESALEAGKFLQARVYRTYYIVFGAGLAIGAFVSLINVSIGLFILVFSALMLITTRLDVLDRLFGRRRARSVLDQPIQLSLGQDGIVWEGPQATSHIPWSSLTEVRSNHRTVLFVRDRLLLAYAPAASFRSAVEQADVVAFSRERIAAASDIVGR